GAAGSGLGIAVELHPVEHRLNVDGEVVRGGAPRLRGREVLRELDGELCEALFAQGRREGRGELGRAGRERGGGNRGRVDDLAENVDGGAVRGGLLERPAG